MVEYGCNELLACVVTAQMEHQGFVPVISDHWWLKLRCFGMDLPIPIPEYINMTNLAPLADFEP